MENWVTGAAEEERLGQMWERSKVQGSRDCWVSQSKPAQNSSTSTAAWLNSPGGAQGLLHLILELSAPHAVVFQIESISVEPPVRGKGWEKQCQKACLQVCLPVSTDLPEQALEMISLDIKISRDDKSASVPSCWLVYPYIITQGIISSFVLPIP